ncbi:bacterial regulatory s, tetR family protein [Mycobacterium kansasii]|uniref:Bacterial regulatory s, tetR family protein n=1 Tax=Mycobacterium kansasii TaxID=1768 RepID=A0A1V3XTN6_MYCKA|nr:bacterial regulatory s, tetR family protein [Mycobacterium kansasii]
MAATAELLVQIGYSNLSLAAVAERAGTTKSALYRRWSSKAELVHEAAFRRPPRHWRLRPAISPPTSR